MNKKSFLDKLKKHYKIILVILVVIISTSYLSYLYTKNSYDKKNIYLEESINGKSSKIISNDLLDHNGKLFYSLCFWVKIDRNNFSKSNNFYKHVLHKGDIQASETQPGIWLDTNSNELILIYKTTKDEDVFMENNLINQNMNPNSNKQVILETIKISNIPLDRWFNVCIVAEYNIVQVYINGELTKTNITDNPIKMNKGDIYIGGKNKHGFNGTISQLRYYNSSKNYKDIMEIYSKGPNPFDIQEVITVEDKS